MNQTLIKLQNQAELEMEIRNMLSEWRHVRRLLLCEHKMIHKALKHLGLWNMEEEAFYASTKTFTLAFQVVALGIAYGNFNVRFNTSLDIKENSELDFYHRLDSIPIEYVGAGELAYELRAPYDKKFFEKLINNECDIIEFGADYVFMLNGKYYCTPKLLSLFSKQPFANYGSESKRN